MDSFSNFDFVYVDLSKRWQRSVELFDQRTFYTAIDQSRAELTRGRAAFQQTGAIASLIYPFDFYHRAEFGVGYLLRKFDQQVITARAGSSGVDPGQGRTSRRSPPASSATRRSTPTTDRSPAGAGG